MIYSTSKKQNENRVIESLNALIMPLTFNREKNILNGFLFRDMSSNKCIIVGSERYKPVNSTFIKKILLLNW